LVNVARRDLRQGRGGGLGDFVNNWFAWDKIGQGELADYGCTKLLTTKMGTREACTGLIPHRISPPFSFRYPGYIHTIAAEMFQVE